MHISIIIYMLYVFSLTSSQSIVHFVSAATSNLSSESLVDGRYLSYRWLV